MHRSPCESTGIHTKRRLLALDGFDPGEIQSVIGERFSNQSPAVIIADQAQPPGGNAQAANLRQVIAGHASGMNLQPVGIYFFFRRPIIVARLQNSRRHSFLFRPLCTGSGILLLRQYEKLAALHSLTWERNLYAPQTRER